MTAAVRSAESAGINPVWERDLRDAARFLAMNPLVLAEREPDMFRLIRRHEQTLDRMFTRRFGYRLQVTADTARLFKSTVIANRRPLRTAARKSRAFSIREYTMLALALAAAVAGPNTISLRELVGKIRSAAADAEIALTEEPADRRALVTALRWMIRHGVASEMHDRVHRYIAEREADALLSVRPDRVALLPLPVLARAETVACVLDRSDQRAGSDHRGPSRTSQAWTRQRGPSRAWMRAFLLEEPVLYRTDLSDDEWTELRRRLGEESALFDEMFGLCLEARAEGVAAIDPAGGLTDSRFPQAGTVGHAALLLIDRLIATKRTRIERSALVDEVAELAAEHRRYWSRHLAENPERLTAEILELLQDHRLAEQSEDGGAVRLLPAASRYGVDVEFRGEQTKML